MLRAVRTSGGLAGLLDSVQPRVAVASQAGGACYKGSDPLCQEALVEVGALCFAAAKPAGKSEQGTGGQSASAGSERRRLGVIDGQPHVGPVGVVAVTRIRIRPGVLAIGALEKEAEPVRAPAT